MLSDFTWNMTGYIPKHQVNLHGDGIIPYVAERIFQLEPEPPAVDGLNEYILSALQEKNLLYFSFFLHHYEPQLNKRIKSLYYRVVVIKAPLQGLCYTVRDAVDW